MNHVHEPVTLLMVEDDDVDAMSMARALRTWDLPHRMVRACDGREALDLLAAGEVAAPYLIVLDLNLPRMGGHDFLEQIRADPCWSHSIVFVYSTSDSPTDIARAQARHVAGYVVKQGAESDTRFVALLRDYCSVVRLRA